MTFLVLSTDESFRAELPRLVLRLILFVCSRIGKLATVVNPPLGTWRTDKQKMDFSLQDVQRHRVNASRMKKQMLQSGALLTYGTPCLNILRVKAIGFARGFGAFFWQARLYPLILNSEWEYKPSSGHEATIK